MKKAYPVIFTPATDGGYTSYVPDFDVNSQGEDLADAIENARDAIGIMGIDMEDEGKALPQPSEKVERGRDDVLSFVDVDFYEYRRQNDNRAVRRNVSLPSWLNSEAEKAGINVSAILQNALKSELGLEK